MQEDKCSTVITIKVCCFNESEVANLSFRNTLENYRKFPPFFKAPVENQAEFSIWRQEYYDTRLCL